jgi:tetratricopeptide (TPR) repeat protein
MTEQNTPDIAIKKAEFLKKITTCAHQQDYKKALEHADEAIQNFPNDTAIAVRRAVLLRQIHRTEESIQELNRLHTLHPENSNILFEMAICHKENGNNETCLNLLNKVLAVKPDHRGALLLRITIYTQIKNFKQALECADEAVKILADDTVILLKKAVLLRQMNRLNESVEELEKLHSLNHDNPQIAFELATSHKENGNNEACLNLLKKVLAVKPDHRGALLQRIAVCSQEQNFKLALEYADNAIKILPDDLNAALRRAVLLRQTNRVAESFLELEKLHSLYPENPQITFELAVSHKSNGNDTECTDLLKKVLADKPDHRGALLQMIITYSQMQNFKLALEYADQAIRFLPNDTVIALRRAVLLRQVHRTEDSIQELEKLHSLDPDNPQITFELAVSHKENGNNTESLNLLEEVLAAAPHHQGALLERISTYELMNDFQQAFKYTEEAITVLPENQYFPMKKVILLQQLYQFDESIELLKKMLAANPDRLDLKERLALAYSMVDDYFESEKLMTDFLDTPTSNKTVRLRQIARHLYRAEFKKAVSLCEEVRQQFPEDLEVKLAYADALSQSRRFAEANTILDSLESDGVQNSNFADVKVRTLLAIENSEVALKWLRNYTKSHSSDKQILSKLLYMLIFYYKLDEAVDLILTSSVKHCLFLPIQIFMLAVVLLANDRKSEAEMILKSLTFPDYAITNRLLPWILKELGRNEEAKNTALQNIAISSNNPIVISENIPILNALGMNTENLENKLSCKNKVSASQISKMGDFLLKSFHGETSPFFPINRTILEIAWSFADQSAYVFEDWATKVAQATDFSILACKAFDSNPEALEAFSKIVDFPDLTILNERYQQRKPFLITTSHFGAPWSLWCLMKHFPEMHYLANYDYPLSNNPFTRNAESNNGDIKSLRKMTMLLKDGRSLAAAADFLPATTNLMPLQKSATGTLFGKKIQLPSILPRLAWRRNIPIYWLQAKAANGRIVYDFEPFPKPRAEDSQEIWCDRWADAFASKLGELVCAPPENISLATPSWQLLANNKCFNC